MPKLRYGPELESLGIEKKPVFSLGHFAHFDRNSLKTLCHLSFSDTF